MTDEESVDHLAQAEQAVERIADLATEAAHPGLSGVTFIRYLVEIGRMVAEHGCTSRRWRPIHPTTELLPVYV